MCRGRVEMPCGRKECGLLEKLKEGQCGFCLDLQERRGPRCIETGWGQAMCAILILCSDRKLLTFAGLKRPNQSCLLSTFSQATHRRPGVCLKVPKEDGTSHTPLGPKNCPCVERSPLRLHSPRPRKHGAGIKLLAVIYRGETFFP